MLENCRVCLKKEAKLMKTTTVMYKKNNIFKNYNEELKFCVPEIDWFCEYTPSFICCTCMQKLEIAADLRRLCLESEKTRKEFIRKLEIDRVESKTSFKSKSASCVVNFETDESDDDFPVNKDVINEHIKTEEAYDDELVKDELDLEAILKSDVNIEDNKCNDKLYVNEKEMLQDSKQGAVNNKLAGNKESASKLKCAVCKDNVCIKSKMSCNIINNNENSTNIIISTEPILCNYCGKTCANSSGYYRHLKIHQNERSYKCDICEKKGEDRSFNTSSGLNGHKLIVHTNHNEWKHLCTICGRKCATKQILTIHTRRHLKDRNVRCPICSKEFYTQTEVRQHALTHSNVRSYKCHICTNDFKQKRILELHLARQHHVGKARVMKAVNKHMCNICSKPFMTRGKLQDHIRSHTREKPFKCNLCISAFGYNQGLKCHMKTFHQLESSIIT